MKKILFLLTLLTFAWSAPQFYHARLITAKPTYSSKLIFINPMYSKQLVKSIKVNPTTLPTPRETEIKKHINVKPGTATPKIISASNDEWIPVYIITAPKRYNKIPVNANGAFSILINPTNPNRIDSSATVSNTESVIVTTTITITQSIDSATEIIDSTGITNSTTKPIFSTIDSNTKATLSFTKLVSELHVTKPKLTTTVSENDLNNLNTKGIESSSFGVPNLITTTNILNTIEPNVVISKPIATTLKSIGYETTFTKPNDLTISTDSNIDSKLTSLDNAASLTTEATITSSINKPYVAKTITSTEPTTTSIASGTTTATKIFTNTANTVTSSRRINSKFTSGVNPLSFPIVSASTPRTIPVMIITPETMHNIPAKTTKTEVKDVQNTRITTEVYKDGSIVLNSTLKLDRKPTTKFTSIKPTQTLPTTDYTQIATAPLTDNAVYYNTNGFSTLKEVLSTPSYVDIPQVTINNPKIDGSTVKVVTISPEYDEIPQITKKSITTDSLVTHELTTSKVDVTINSGDDIPKESTLKFNTISPKYDEIPEMATKLITTNTHKFDVTTNPEIDVSINKNSAFTAKVVTSSPEFVEIPQITKKITHKSTINPGVNIPKKSTLKVVSISPEYNEIPQETTSLTITSTHKPTTSNSEPTISTNLEIDVSTIKSTTKVATISPEFVEIPQTTTKLIAPTKEIDNSTNKSTTKTVTNSPEYVEIPLITTKLPRRRIKTTTVSTTMQDDSSWESFETTVERVSSRRPRKLTTKIESEWSAEARNIKPTRGPGGYRTKSVDVEVFLKPTPLKR